MEGLHDVGGCFLDCRFEALCPGLGRRILCRGFGGRGRAHGLQNGFGAFRERGPAVTGAIGRGLLREEPGFERRELAPAERSHCFGR